MLISRHPTYYRMQSVGNKLSAPIKKLSSKDSFTLPFDESDFRSVSTSIGELFPPFNTTVNHTQIYLIGGRGTNTTEILELEERIEVVAAIKVLWLAYNIVVLLVVLVVFTNQAKLSI